MIIFILLYTYSYADHIFLRKNFVENPLITFPWLMDRKRGNSSTMITRPNPDEIKIIEPVTSPIVGGEISHIPHGCSSYVNHMCFLIFIWCILNSSKLRSICMMGGDKIYWEKSPMWHDLQGGHQCFVSHMLCDGIVSQLS